MHSVFGDAHLAVSIHRLTRAPGGVYDHNGVLRVVWGKFCSKVMTSHFPDPLPPSLPHMHARQTIQRIQTSVSSPRDIAK